MDKKEFIKKIKEHNEIIALCEFGSYGTEYWIKDRSDIDLIIVVGPKVTFLDTLEIEDEIKEAASKFYNYDNIHLRYKDK